MKIALPKSIRRERLLVIILPLNQAARRAELEFEIVLNFVVQATNRADKRLQVLSFKTILIILLAMI